jgi:hypothetical protein
MCRSSVCSQRSAYIVSKAGEILGRATAADIKAPLGDESGH